MTHFQCSYLEMKQHTRMNATQHICFWVWAPIEIDEEWKAKT